MPGSVRLPSELVRRLRRVRSVGAITGAGISAESGIRTYRGQGGLYDDPEEGDRTVEALSGATLLRDPDRTWNAVARLFRQAVGARPSRGHVALAAIERRVERFVLLTQNVDGLHRQAGSRNVIEIHGDIRRARCTGCGAASVLAAEALVALERSPRCAACRAVLRPDAVLFGELLPGDKVERMRAEFQRDVPDLVLVVGTSALFPYISEPAWVARQGGRLTVEINPQPTPLSSVVEFSLRGTAGDYLPPLARSLPPSASAPPRRPRDRFGRPLPAGSRDELAHREEPERVASSADDAIARAVRLFDERRFFEAHEFFEHVWNSEETADEDRDFWRAVTQVAVGCCHVQRDNREGAAAVLERGARNLEGYPAVHHAVDTRALIDLARGLVRELRGGADTLRFPRFPRFPRGL